MLKADYLKEDGDWIANCLSHVCKHILGHDVVVMAKETVVDERDGFHFSTARENH